MYLPLRKGGVMKVSAVTLESAENCKPGRNSFIAYANSFMSMPEKEDASAKALDANQGKSKKMGIENLEAFTIFPKEVIDGKMVITA